MSKKLHDEKKNTPSPSPPLPNLSGVYVFTVCIVIFKSISLGTALKPVEEKWFYVNCSLFGPLHVSDRISQAVRDDSPLQARSQQRVTSVCSVSTTE